MRRGLETQCTDKDGLTLTLYPRGGGSGCLLGATIVAQQRGNADPSRHIIEIANPDTGTMRTSAPLSFEGHMTIISRTDGASHESKVVITRSFGFVIEIGAKWRR